MRKLKITELNRISAEEFKQAEKLPLVVVLDDIRSLHNIGSVFRTSDAFRIECIYLCGITATPPHPEMHKTALGAEFTVDWKYVITLLMLLITSAKKDILLFDRTGGRQHYAGSTRTGQDEEVRYRNGK